MQRMTMFALAAIVTTVVPSTAYYLTIPSNDPHGDMLRSFGFIPINPPSTLMSVGSLYYVDSKVRDFTAICHADESDLRIFTKSSPSWEMQQSLARSGRLATGIDIDFGWLIKNNVDKNYVVKVQSSLTDVLLEEMPLGSSRLIFAKLMEQSPCNQVAMQYLHAGGYVCQGQKILRATAEYKLDSDAQSKLAAKATAAAGEIKEIVKLAVASQADQTVIDKEDRLFAGKALNYGVSMNPLCLAPTNARFERILPRTALGRFANFVMFNIIEPMLPEKGDGLKVAQGATAAGMPGL